MFCRLFILRLNQSTRRIARANCHVLRSLTCNHILLHACNLLSRTESIGNMIASSVSQHAQGCKSCPSTLARRIVRANCYALNITYMQSYFVFCCMLATFYLELNQSARWLHPLALSMCKVVPCWLPNSTILLFIGSQHCAYRFPNLSDLKYGLINSSDIKKTQPSIHN